MTIPAHSAQAEAPSAPQLTITPLTEADATAEYALARMQHPELDECRWLTFLQEWRSAPESRGILSVRNQRGAVLGFVPWWLQPDFQHGECLWAGPFVVHEMGVRPLVRDSLTQALEKLAQQRGVGLRLAPNL